jgi:hypothetical protein
MIPRSFGGEPEQVLDMVWKWEESNEMTPYVVDLCSKCGFEHVKNFYTEMDICEFSGSYVTKTEFLYDNNGNIIKTNLLGRHETGKQEAPKKVETKDKPKKNHYSKRIGDMAKERAALRMWKGARSRCNSNGRVFDITVEDVLEVFEDVCPILKRPFDLACDAGEADPLSPSLDRIDSTKGYKRGNIYVISHRANSLKRNFPVDDLISLGKYVEMTKI